MEEGNVRDLLIDINNELDVIKRQSYIRKDDILKLQLKIMAILL